MAAGRSAGRLTIGAMRNQRGKAVVSASSPKVEERLVLGLRHEIAAHVITTLYRRMRPLLVANIGTAWLLAATLWRPDDGFQVIVWAAVLSGWTSVRYLLARAYLARPRGPSEAQRWILYFAAGAGVGGILWGSSVVFVVGFDAEADRLVLTFVIAALSAAALAGYSNSLLAFGAFVVPSLLPYGIALILLGGSYRFGIAGFFAAWLFLIWVMARHLNREYRESVALHLHNARLVEHLLGARNSAEAADQAKTRFLANMSHELRTPLNAIIGFAEMMLRRIFGAIGDKRYEAYAKNIHDSGLHLLKIVDEMLDVSRLAAGRVVLVDDRVDIAELVAGAIEAITPHAAADQIAVAAELEPGLPPLRADATKMRQVLLNLLSNAVKFTPPGGSVTVRGSLLPGRGLAIAVADTGVGIAPEDLDKVTIPFAMLEQREHLKRVRAQKRDRGQNSNGLGLPLVKMLVELHNGRLELISELGAGTVATISFPPERLIERETLAAGAARHAA
jgi:signal transduction histidine kinase